MAQPANRSLTLPPRGAPVPAAERNCCDRDEIAHQFVVWPDADTFIQNISGLPHGPTACADGTLRHSVSKSPTLRALADEVME
jgi:hypothetical protein